MARLLLQSLILVCVAGFALGQDLSKSELTRLYNTGVKYAQKYFRPLSSSGSGFGFTFGIPHAGVVITTANNERWLIHKGNGYGRESQTVVTRAHNMSSKWKKRGPRKSIKVSTVSDYVRAGRARYRLFRDNCLHAAARMMQLN